jgi:hypothetical protein
MTVDCIIHPVHAENPFIYRLECPSVGCKNIVWPDEIENVTAYPAELRGDDDYRCSGCIATWLREGKITPQDVLRLRGASEGDVTAWMQKCADALPVTIYEGD